MKCQEDCDECSEICGGKWGKYHFKCPETQLPAECANFCDEL